MFPEIKENNVIDELYKQLCILKESVLANTKKYGPNHPRMVEANAGIKGLEQEVKKVCSSIKRELDSIIAFESTNPKMQEYAGTKAFGQHDNVKVTLYERCGSIICAKSSRQ